VESFRYHYHSVEHEGERGDEYEHWFHVERDDGGARFSVVVRVSRVGAHLAKTSPESLAECIGTDQVKGLIDLGYESGRQYKVIREGPPPSEDERTADIDLQLAILRALRNARRAEDRSGTIESMSLDGLAQVLTITRYRLEDSLSDLLTAGRRALRDDDRPSPPCKAR
jgi:hypothetical protein